MVRRGGWLALVVLLLGACPGEDPVRDDHRVGDASSDSEPSDLGRPDADGTVAPDSAKADADHPVAVDCPKLPAATGTTVKVTPGQAQQLPGIVSSAKSGTTILLEDGTYTMSGNEGQRRLTFATPDVTLRSVSGQADKVIIDGEYTTLEIIFIRADDVTIADLTIKRAVDHLIHVTGASSDTIKNTRLYNLRLVDSGEQFVKINSDGNGHYVDDGRLECSQLEMTAQGRPHIETNPGGCYTGGIDAHSAWGWQVRLNTFKGIYCDTGKLAEHAVHFWSASRDTLVERNTIVDCARGVGFGLTASDGDRSYLDDPYPSVGYIGHIDGIIRNNVIHASPQMAQFFDTGIELSQAHGGLVYHNTVVSKPTYSSIDYRFANTQVEIRNNLTYKVTVRDGAKGTVDHNLQSAPASLFVNASGVDYHLVSTATQAIDKGMALTKAGLDLDGKAHDVGAPDLGALELQQP